MISVILATTNQGGLSSVLRDLEVQSPGQAWEVCVVDTTRDNAVETTLRAGAYRLPMRVVRCPGASKAGAVNRGCGLTAGELVAIVDDDLRLGPSWLAEYERAASRSPLAAMFCGPVDGTRALYQSAWHQWALECVGATFRPAQGAGLLRLPYEPHGANLMMRRELLERVHLREDLGPGVPECPFREHLAMVEYAGRDGTMFVPSAQALHCLPMEAYDASSIYDRAFFMGRSRARQMVTQPSRPLYRRQMWVEGSPSWYVASALALNMHYGELSVLIEGPSEGDAAITYLFICALAWAGDIGILGPSAFRWLQRHMDYVPPAAREAFVSASAQRLAGRVPHSDH